MSAWSAVPRLIFPFTELHGRPARFSAARGHQCAQFLHGVSDSPVSNLQALEADQSRSFFEGHIAAMTEPGQQALAGRETRHRAKQRRPLLLQTRPGLGVRQFARYAQQVLVARSAEWGNGRKRPIAADHEWPSLTGCERAFDACNGVGCLARGKRRQSVFQPQKQFVGGHEFEEQVSKGLLLECGQTAPRIRRRGRARPGASASRGRGCERQP